VSYSEQEKIILNVLRKAPRSHYNKLQKESGLNKKTFDKHLKSLIARGKIRSYEFEGKTHYLIKTGKDRKGILTCPLPHDEKIEWQIAWELQDSQELFDAMKKSFDSVSLDESDTSFARFVLEKILRNVLSVIMHDALLEPEKNPHRKFIIQYKKLIHEFFKFIVDKETIIDKKPNVISKESVEKKLIRSTKEFKIKISKAEEAPFAKEIARMYSETDHLDFLDDTFRKIFADNIEFSLSSLILDDNKIKNLKK
jgi:DNA-binding Lrp family transcriptional regulator